MNTEGASGHRRAASLRPVSATLLSALATSGPAAARESGAPPQEKRIRASHEDLDPRARVDELGIFVPTPVSDPL